VLAILNVGEIKDLDPIDLVNFHKFWGKDVLINCRPQTSWSHRSDLGFIWLFYSFKVEK
jgi:hypothetical protein